MKIVSLHSENIKRLTAVHITPEGNVVQITGKNGNGKSSVLDSIWYALGGTRNIPDKPIRKGAKKAEVVLDLGELIVTRKFNKTGTTLNITNAKGVKFASPQKILDDLVGSLTFDPLGFMRMDANKQLETLRQVAGVDTADLDEQIKIAYDERALVNRDGKAKAGALEQLVKPEGERPEEVEVSELMIEINKAQDDNEAIRLAEQKTTEATELCETYEDEIKELKEQIETAQISLVEAEQAYEENKKAQDKLGPRTNIDDLQDKVRKSAETNASARAHDAYQSADQAVDLLRSEAGKLTEKLESLNEAKETRIQEADFPLDGLSVDEDSVLWNDIPLDQASSAEQLRVSVAMAMSINPKLRVLRIQDGSLLDTESMKILEEMADKEDYQIWIERVDETGKVGVVIEDGHVAGVETEKEPTEEVTSER